jgi:RNA polymerase sigma factor (TIGR02999 family)
MSDVTRILSDIEQGNPQAARQLLPLVYDELRKLAAAKLANERPGQTLQATALVHEAYLRLVDGAAVRNWESRGHFFAAAAEAMRRILVDNARRKLAEVHGGAHPRREFSEDDLVSRATPDEVVALDDSLARLGEEDPPAAELVKLRVFAGFSIDEAAEILGISRATAYRHWTYARAWLRAELRGDGEVSQTGEKPAAS